jgi:hypothetical protein
LQQLHFLFLLELQLFLKERDLLSRESDTRENEVKNQCWELACVTTVLKNQFCYITIVLKNWTNQVTNQKPADSLLVLSQKLQVLNSFEITRTSGSLIMIFIQRTRASSSLILKYLKSQNPIVLWKFKWPHNTGQNSESDFGT